MFELLFKLSAVEGPGSGKIRGIRGPKQTSSVERKLVLCQILLGPIQYSFKEAEMPSIKPLIYIPIGLWRHHDGYICYRPLRVKEDGQVEVGLWPILV